MFFIQIGIPWDLILNSMIFQFDIAYDQFVDHKNIINRFKKIYQLYKLEINNRNLQYLDLDEKRGEFPIYNQVITKNPKKLINYLKEEAFIQTRI